MDFIMGKKYLLGLGLIVMLFLLQSCNRIEKKEFSPKNPTSYVFDVDKETLKKAIKVIFEESSYKYLNFNNNQVLLYISYETILRTNLRTNYAIVT